MAVTLAREPQAAPEHPAPETDQVTPLFCESFCTVALKLAAVDTWTEVDAGLTETEMGRGEAVTVTLAEAVFVESAFEMADTLNVAGVGTEAGAVYSPVAEIVPKPDVPPVIPLTCQEAP